MGTFVKKLIVYFLFLPLFVTAALAAVPQQRRGTAAATSNNTASTSTRTNAVSARSATTTARAATPTATTTTARAATTGRTTVARSATTTTTTSTPVVTARAGATQKVINTGTKITTATQATIVSDDCRQKYYGCMDSFCMLDNSNGGRCICSNTNAELNSMLEEINELNQQSYMLATVGIETLESGTDIKTTKEENRQDSIDLSLWQPAQTSLNKKDDEKIGYELFVYSNDICAERIPECSKELSTLQLMYSQQIKSDCTAYENSLKKLKSESTQKMTEAQRALQDLAINQARDANKYNLGQCATEFKNCMKTTGGCGEDFSLCALNSAQNNTKPIEKDSETPLFYSIVGESTSLEISWSMYNTLLAKKPLCESVTKNCVSVADQVWDAFLKEAGPELKVAELIAEDNVRQDCVGHISDCFQKACKDNIDPNDPDGSYDMCLTRPESMLSFCKAQLNSCGVNSNSAEDAEKSPIWEYVVARLASMRVDSCTTAVKECLQSEDMCGADYTQCIGLDTDTIIRMCPYDKLTGCQLKYGDTEIRGNDVYEILYNTVQGIMLNIDNSFLTECQNAVDEALIKVCGSAENCDDKIVAMGLGANSLEYKICEYFVDEKNFGINYDLCLADLSQVPDTALGRVPGGYEGTGPIAPLTGVIDGTIYWENIDIDENGNLISADEYFKRVGDEGVPEVQKERVSSEISSLQRGINSIISAVESDPTVQYCMTGRQVAGVILPKTANVGNNARFPNLTKQTRLAITNSALKKAKDNYYKKFDELNEKMTQDYAKIAERVAEIRGENSKDLRREAARQACVSLVDLSALPKSETPKSAIGTAIIITAIIVATVLVTVFTAGAGTIAAGAAAAAGSAAMSAGSGAAISSGIGAVVTSAKLAASAAFTASMAASKAIAITAGTLGAATVVGGVAAQSYNGDQVSNANYQIELNGRHETDQWNFKEVITTEFDMDTLVCHKCVKTTQCEKTKTPVFGDLYCKTWAEPVEVCSDIQF